MEMEKSRAILVNVTKDKVDYDILEELKLLANTADYETVGMMVQHKEVPDKTYYIGTGKLDELKQAIAELNADIVIFDNDISGSQFFNLEKYLEVDVIDRATLILEIFAKHASSNEGKLQVELARKKHGLRRALGQSSALSRQGGGGGGGGGARRGGGEQQLELDKRTIKEEIRNLEEKIDKLTQERRLRREKRIQSRIKHVSIIGYTNAGKSTLMNYLTKANVLAEDKLFATLDPVSRKLWLAPKKEFILTDTVGFISRLPHEFIDAFKSTLEETKYADLILHVVNGDSDDILKEYDVVMEVVKSLGAENIPTITVLNKCDIGKNDLLPDKENVVVVSAKTGQGMDILKQKISFMLFGEEVIWE
ncbi:GTPase HflX [bacterium]|nr:GTPase HflX [bacterium]